jgi:UDP-N-acetylmuramoylalanine--D-glutamate ligase
MIAMTRPAFALRDPRLAGCRVLVVGLGKSGLAAARLALSRGARVTIADAKPEHELGETAARARELGAAVLAGGHPPSLLADVDLVVTSPGIPSRTAVLVEARRTGIPVWGEIELASRFCRGRVVGITGSNGKSTVTAMTGTILRGAGIPGGTGGNLDVPFCDLLVHDADDAVHAIELSSFQLETVEALRPAVAVILNLSPDHLDRHGDLDGYAAAKARLLEVQDAAAAAILNADDAPSARFESSVRGRLHRFSTREELERGAFLRRGRLLLRLPEGERELLDAEALPVRGEHNVANALAAALATALVGCSADQIVQGLLAFRALPHRLEHVATIDGVAFYNDSKATNPASTARALVAFGPGTVHLILGGRDKGSDWSEILPLVAERTRQVLLVGESTALLRGLLAAHAPALVDAGTVARAVELGHAAARPGEVVLLAPGCASFDQYRNFAERGEDFRSAVERLSGRRGPHA